MSAHPGADHRVAPPDNGPMSGPHLTRRAPAGAPRGVVLMLHGGAEHNTEPVDGRNRAWLRSRVMMRQLQRGWHDDGLAVWLLRYTVRGWNHAGDGPHLPSPVPDARWALEQVRATYGETPVVLVGHSMGGRTAAAVADDPAVAGVVALAPWFPEGEPVAPLAGRMLLAAHGRKDEITSYAATRAFVARAAQVATRAELTDMGEVGHYMISGARRWNRFAADAVTQILGPS